MPLWNRHESPQIRRLKNDHAAMERLLTESSILQFKTSGSIPTRYLVEFSGRTLGREKGRISVRTTQRVEISLGASYPRSMPEIRWITPVFHPNISEIGTVCLGGYGTHWVPSLHLDDLCGMLWDRFAALITARRPSGAPRRRATPTPLMAALCEISGPQPDAWTVIRHGVCLHQAPHCLAQPPFNPRSSLNPFQGQTIFWSLVTDIPQALDARFVRDRVKVFRR